MNAKAGIRAGGAALTLFVVLWAAGAAPQNAASKDHQTALLVKAYNASGQELFRSFAGQPGNIVFSPYSIGTAMAMVLSGARGETQSEMSKALRHGLAPPAIDAANASALAVLNAYNQPQPAPCPDGFTLKDTRCEAAAPKDGDCPADARRDGNACIVEGKAPALAKVRIANALMLVNAAATVAPDFEQTIRTQYGSEIFTKAGLDTVNAWVKDKTEGKIDKILERLSPNDSHVLLNAVYFNAPWAQAFAPGATRERDFKLTPAETVAVPTMSQQGEFAIAAGEGFAAIRLPYAVDGLSMIVLRPDEVDGLGAVTERFDGAQIDALIESIGKARKKPVSLSMPRFKTQFAADLIPPFKSLGMAKVFDPAQSDLSGLTGLPREQAQSSIDQILHRAVIEVAEEGTEAAAVTAVVVTTRTMNVSGPESFQIDRPFMFLITDDKTGAILFAGRIADPRK